MLTHFDLWSAHFADAGMPQAGKQAASFYRYKVGDIEVTVVNDGIVRIPVNEAFVLNVNPEDGASSEDRTNQLIDRL